MSNEKEEQSRPISNDTSTAMNDYTSYGNTNANKINGAVAGIVKVPKPPEVKIPQRDLPFSPNRL